LSAIAGGKKGVPRNAALGDNKEAPDPAKAALEQSGGGNGKASLVQRVTVFEKRGTCQWKRLP
jgi:hypothetical protein